MTLPRHTRPSRAANCAPSLVCDTVRVTRNHAAIETTARYPPREGRGLAAGTARGVFVILEDLGLFVQAGGVENNPLADVDGMVGNPLQILGYHEGIDSVVGQILVLTDLGDLIA